MKCPVCNMENKNPPLKRWAFNVYEVSRYKCSECGNNFNTYMGEKNSYTIPKTSGNEKV